MSCKSRMSAVARPGAWPVCQWIGVVPILLLACAIGADRRIMARSFDEPDFGSPLPGLTAAQRQRFIDGKEAFERVETDADGIGPVFNGRSCAECHGSPATGGGSSVLSTRFGTIANGVFDPLLEFGGPTLQSQGSLGLLGYQFAGEVIPAQATIVARRRATALFGFGLVDAVPDADFHTAADLQAQRTPLTAGRPNLVRNLQSGAQVVGRFGWKAGRANLFDFSADAYKDEMGITVPGFVADEDGRLISEENPPQGNLALLAFNLLGDPNEPENDDVHAFNDFLTFLSPPPRRKLSASALRGEAIFHQIGCADCHQPTLRTGPNSVQALHMVEFNPYSDFLLHDMGSLGDGIEQGRATGREMRTAPLWGLRKLPFFLHDGRARNVFEAILLHDGQGRAARDRFAAFRRKSAEREDLLAFLYGI